MASIRRHSPSNFSVRFLRQSVRKSRHSTGRKMKTVPFTDSKRLKRDIRSMLRAGKKATGRVPPIPAARKGEQARDEGMDAGRSPPAARSQTRLPRGFGRKRVPLLPIGGDNISADIGSETLKGTKYDVVPSEAQTSRALQQDHVARVRERRQQQLDRWRKTLQSSLTRLTENELETPRDAFVSQLRLREHLAMERHHKHMQEFERKRLLQSPATERSDGLCPGNRSLDWMSNTACAEPLNMKGVSFDSRQTKNSFWVPKSSRLDINVGPNFKFGMSRFGRNHIFPSVILPKNA